MTPPFRLIFLGGAALEGPEGGIGGRIAQPRSMALLALLAAVPAGITRDKILGYLWPQADAAQARHLLSNALYHVRKNVGADAVIGRGESLQLNSAHVTADTAELKEALSRGDLTRAIELYRGPFLDGFYLSDAPEFERWVEAERSRLLRSYTQALEAAARAREHESDPTGAVHWWSRLAETEPYNSRVAAQLARALRTTGDPAGALRVIRSHAEHLRADLGVEPPHEITTLLAELRPPTAPQAAERPRSRNGGTDGSGRNGVSQQPLKRNAVQLLLDPIRRASLRRRTLLLAAAGLAAAILLAVAGRSIWSHSASRRIAVALAADSAHGLPQLLIGDFVAIGTDTNAGSIVTEALRADLEGSSTIRALGVGSIRDALHRMELPPGTPIRGTVARDLALREGLPLALEGDVRASGGAYLLTARLIAPADNTTLAGFRETATSANHLIAAIDRLSKSIRTRLGESLQQVSSSPPLDRVTTSSLEALQQFTLARRAMREGDHSAAALLLDRAVTTDSTFAMAHSYLATVRAGTFDDSRAAAARARAFQYRHKLPLFERYRVEGMYWWQEGFPDRAAVAWEAALQIRPRDVGMLNNLAVYYGAREPDKFAAMAARAYQEGSGAPASAQNYAVALFRQGQFDAALRVLQGPEPAPLGMTVMEAHMRCSRGQHTLAERRLIEAWEKAEGRSGQHMTVAWALAGVTAIQGRVRESIRWMERVKESPGLSRTDSLRAETVIARLMAFVAHDTASARSRLALALARQRPQSLPIEARPLLDIAHAYAATAQHAMADLTLREYEDSLPRALRWRQRMFHGLLAGSLALAAHDPQRAAEAFHASGREGCRRCEYLGMGRVYDATAQRDSAIVNFERYLTVVDPFRWPEDSFWLGATLERLGQLYQSQGNPEKAAEYYQRFAELWQHADAELQPRVRIARAAVQEGSR